MILGPISLLDCLVFVICLIPQLLLQGPGLGELILVLCQIIPFLRKRVTYETAHVLIQ